jgi:predicted PurR-regulated permease PerM
MPKSSGSRFFVQLLLVAAVLLALWVARPFWSALFLALVVSATLEPVTIWLAKRLGGRRASAAGFLTLALVLVVLLPLGFIVGVVVEEALGAVDWIRSVMQSEGMTGLIGRLPTILRDPVARVLAMIPQGTEAVVELVRSQGGNAAALLGGALSAAGQVLFQVAMFVIALYCFLCDGPSLVGWFRSALPLRQSQFDHLLAEMRNVTVAALSSTVATAGVQTVVAFVGYLIAGVPKPFFFGLLTFCLAMIPAAGAAIVVLLLALLQLATGSGWAALFLLAWAGAVSFADNLVKPMLMKGRVAINGGVVFFSLIGGFLAFGTVGIVAGPLVAAFLISSVRLAEEERNGILLEAEAEGEK